MTEAEQKQSLAEVLADYARVHCNGCDEWMCDHEPGEDEELLKRMVEDVWQTITSWSKK